jgi:hypothetical protein
MKKPAKKAVATVEDVQPAGQRYISETKEFAFRMEGISVDFAQVGHILKVTLPDGLGEGIVENKRIYRRIVEKINFYEPRERDGKLYGYAVQCWICEENNDKIEPEWEVLIEASKTPEEAMDMFNRINSRLQKWEDAQRKKFKPFASMKATELDTHKAQEKVLKELWPKTMAKLENGEDARAVFRAEADKDFSAMIESGEEAEAQRIRRKQRENPGRVDKVKQELSLHWIGKGYEKMRGPRLSEEIFNVTGIRLNPKALRRIHERLGLMTHPDLTTGPDTKVP